MKIAELYLEDEDPVAADTFCSRAAMVMHEVGVVLLKSEAMKYDEFQYVNRFQEVVLLLKSGQRHPAAAAVPRVSRGQLRARFFLDLNPRRESWIARGRRVSFQSHRICCSAAERLEDALDGSCASSQRIFRSFEAWDRAIKLNET